MVAHAHKGDVIWQLGRKRPFWKKNKLLPCWNVEPFLVRNSNETDILKTELNYQDFFRESKQYSYIEISASNKSRTYFRIVYWS